MENSGLLAVKSMVCAEYTVKKSQFFAYALPLYSLAEIPERLAYVRELHKEARHPFMPGNIMMRSLSNNTANSVMTGNRRKRQAHRYFMF